jgi:hypothetical protein
MFERETNIQMRNARIAKENAQKRAQEIRRRLWNAKREGEGHSAAFFRFGRCV